MKRKDPVEDPVVWLRQAADPGAARIDQGDFKASVKEAFFFLFFFLFLFFFFFLFFFLGMYAKSVDADASRRPLSLR